MRCRFWCAFQRQFKSRPENHLYVLNDVFIVLIGSSRKMSKYYLKLGRIYSIHIVFNSLFINHHTIDTTKNVSKYIIYCNGFDQSFARQQLCKHGPTCNSRWGCVFYVVRATLSAGNGKMNSQSDAWYVLLCVLRHATIECLCFLCVVRAERI
jgi:hypothetical protein